MNEYTDEQKSVLQIKFEDGTKCYLAKSMYMTVDNPYYATRFHPIDNDFESQKSRDKDVKWMKTEFDAEISFVPFLEAYKDYKEQCDNC